MQAHRGQETGRAHWEQGFVQLGVTRGEKGRRVEDICKRVITYCGLRNLTCVRKKGKEDTCGWRFRDGLSKEWST